MFTLHDKRWNKLILGSANIIAVGSFLICLWQVIFFLFAFKEGCNVVTEFCHEVELDQSSPEIQFLLLAMGNQTVA